MKSLGLMLLKNMGSSRKKQMIREFETDLDGLILRGEIGTTEDTIGDPTVVNGTTRVHSHDIIELEIFQGDDDVTSNYKKDPQEWDRLQHYFIESFKMECCL